MRTLGLIGGMSWESTAVYYSELNRGIAARLGGTHSAKLLLYSVDFHEIEVLQHRGEWQQAGLVLAEAARALERGGAQALLICSNTMHKVADTITQGLNIPMLHIADATANAVLRTGVRTVGLLGTRYTMEHEFYRGRLEERGLSVIVPSEVDREIVNRVIYEELCLGKVLDESREAYRRIIRSLVAEGAEGVIYGCTEIGLLVGPDDCSVPAFDTARIHVQAAVDFATAMDAGAQ